MLMDLEQNFKFYRPNVGCIQFFFFELQAPYIEVITHSGFLNLPRAARTIYCPNVGRI